MKRISAALIGLIVVMVGVAGCRRAGSDITVKNMATTGDNMITGAQKTAQEAVEGAKVVTAEPAMVEDDKTKDDAPTAEDKTGAVAVKVAY